jgi:hypothetical protein
MIYDERGVLGGMRIGTETEVLRENMLQCHFAHHKSHTSPELEPEPQRWEAGD